MKPYRLGVIGAGTMGMAIVQGALRTKQYPIDSILLYHHTPSKQEASRKLGFHIANDMAEVYTGCDAVLFAMKPQQVAEVLSSLQTCSLASAPLVVSILAGTPFQTFADALGQTCPIIRVMPNTPLLIGQGATALCANQFVTENQMQTVMDLFSSLGYVQTLAQENQLNDIIPFNGSLPAFVYQMIDAFALSAEEHGFSYEQILPMIAHTFAGAAHMVLQNDKTPTQLCQDVCSPAGTTIQGVTALQEGGLYPLIAKACDCTIARAYELGQNR